MAAGSEKRGAPPDTGRTGPWGRGLAALAGRPRGDRRRAASALCAGLALLAGLASLFELELWPPGIERRTTTVGTAVVHMLVERPATERDPANPTTLDDLRAEYQLDALRNRAPTLAHALASHAAIKQIARAAGVEADAIAAATQNTTSIPRDLVEPDSERRASQLVDARRPLRVELQPRPGEPLIDVYAAAPTPAEAARLANAVVAGGNAFLERLAIDSGTGPRHRLAFVRLGPPATGAVGGRLGLGVTALALALALASAGLALHLARGPRPDAPAPSAPPHPPRGRGRRVHARRRREGARGSPSPAGAEDAWPRTWRPLPWALAAFLALLWLTPFNAITLPTGLPVDLTLDRLAMPVVLAVWLAALLRGGPGAPRLRATPIHLALAVFAAIACLSVLANAQELAHGLILELSLKKLGLLATFAALFVVVASSVRTAEVRPFLVYTVALACVCAGGMLIEYRSGANVFYDAAAAVLPPGFDLAPPPTGFDELGRGSVAGPTDHGLEAAAVLAMTLPVALVGFSEPVALRRRIAYGLAACLLGAAAIATFRKSGLLAPLAAVLVLVCLAPRRIPRLAPLAILVALVLPFTSFQALGSVTGQLDANNLDVPTVGARVADYNAIRPDFLSHPLLGSGFGSYEHATNPSENRILDSDLLLRLVEVGTLGLAAFLGLVATVTWVGARVARGPDSARRPVGVAVAAGAVAFGVLAAFFDEWSFPHAPYVFLTLAGLLAASARSADSGRDSAPRRAPRGKTRPSAAKRSWAAAGKQGRSTAR